MAEQKNNPELVEELINGLWTMDHDEFEEKYASLNSDDMAEVAQAIDGMEAEFLEGDDEDDDERISVDEAADIWVSHGKDEDYMSGYSEEELEAAL